MYAQPHHAQRHTGRNLRAGLAMTTDYAGPISGHSAAINSAEFYICPECHACVMESRSDDWHRKQHAAWHAGLRYETTATERPTP